MIELMDMFGRTWEMVKNKDQTTATSSQHHRYGVGTLQLTPRQAKRMEITFDLIARALWQKRQAMTRKKKRRGGRLEASTAK